MKHDLIIPENLATIAPILTRYLEPLLAWFSQLVYERLIGLNRAHLLVKLKQLVDFRELEAVCAAYHQGKGKGRPIEHGVEQLLRAMMVKYLYHCSLRQLEERIRTDMVVKWFVGYPLHAAGPDHSTLERFEVYLMTHHRRRYFDTILAQIDAAFPQERQQPQIGDSWAMVANAAMEPLIDRLRHTMQELLRAYRAAAPAAYGQLWGQLDQAALFGQPGEPRTYLLDEDQWQQRVLRTVNAARDWVGLVQQQPVPATVQIWIERLEKIVNDELAWERDENGHMTQVALLPEKKRGSYRICSATDPEATLRNHGPGKQALGYNVSVAVTPNFIREIQADTGSRPDLLAIPELLQAQRQYHHLCPDKFIYDQAAGLGKAVYLVDQATDGQTQLVAKPVLKTRPPDRLAPEDFSLSPDGLALTCPRGRTSYRKYPACKGDGYHFKFLKNQCLGCPFLQPCRGSPEAPTRLKSVFISDYRTQWDRLVAYAQTQAFEQDMKVRLHVERLIAALVNHNGARRARFRGLAKVDFQAKMCAMAYNLKRWVALRCGRQPQKRRPLGPPLPTQVEVCLLTA